MKKLCELTKEELQKLYDDNTQFRIACWEVIQDDHNYWQNDRYNEYFEKDARGFQYHDNYASFYYTLTDAEEFCKGLRDTARDYFDTEAQKHFDRLFENWEKWQNMTWEEQDENEKVYLIIETEAKYILKCIEDDLKSFDDITEDDEQDILQRIYDGEIFGEYTTDGEKVYWQETHILK